VPAFLEPTLDYVAQHVYCWAVFLGCRGFHVRLKSRRNGEDIVADLHNIQVSGTGFLVKLAGNTETWGHFTYFHRRMMGKSKYI
jgi:hypothetical protein